MSRHHEVEAILEAWYELETGAANEKTRRLRKLHDLLDEAIAKADIEGVSRIELKELLGDAYRDYRHGKRKGERSKLSRLR